jgi:hypothetical protein
LKLQFLQPVDFAPSANKTEQMPNASAPAPGFNPDNAAADGMLTSYHTLSGF